MPIYTQAFVEALGVDDLIETFQGNTQLPVTVELLEIVCDLYADGPEAVGLVGQVVGTPFVSEEVLDWVAAFAERQGNATLRAQASADARASYELMLTAPPGAFTLHSLQSFVWKHSIETGHLWTKSEYGLLRAKCEAAAFDGAVVPPTMNDLIP